MDRNVCEPLIKVASEGNADATQVGLRSSFDVGNILHMLSQQLVHSLPATVVLLLEEWYFLLAGGDDSAVDTDDSDMVNLKALERYIVEITEEMSHESYFLFHSYLGDSSVTALEA